MELQDKLKEIKTRLRLSMNGAVSKSMRDKGLVYKLNFGVDIPRLKSIAAEWDQNHELAQALWKEDIREAKILAAMLQPIDSFYPEIADLWVEDIRYMEIAELTCMNLFRYLPYAASKSFQWMADEREMVQTCGLLLVARLLMEGATMNERAESEFLDQTLAAVLSGNHNLHTAAMLSIKKYVIQSVEQAQKVEVFIEKMRQSEKQQERFIYQEIKFEIDSLH